MAIIPDRKFAVARAKAEGYTLKSIASEIGATPAALSAVVRRDSQHSPLGDLLDRWLIKQGFSEKLDWDSIIRVPDHPWNVPRATFAVLSRLEGILWDAKRLPVRDVPGFVYESLCTLHKFLLPLLEEELSRLSDSEDKSEPSSGTD